MMHVGMNIEDKPRLFREVRHVLKPGGQFAVSDVMRTGEGALAYPVHWATDARTSFVASPSVYRRGLEAAGLDIVKERDRGDFAREFFRQAAARAAAAGGPPPLGIHLLMRSDVPRKLANLMANLEKGLIAPTEMVCHARRRE